MSSKTARICTSIPIIIVSENSKINVIGDTDYLKYGNKLMELTIPVYCDIIIKMENGRDLMDNAMDEKCPLNSMIKIAHISRLHIGLESIDEGYFLGEMTIGTKNSSLTCDCTIIRIGHGDKSDTENKKYCQDLYNKCKLSAIVKPDCRCESDILAVYKIIMTNFSTIISDPDLRTCMEATQIMAQSTNIKTEILNAIKTLRYELS